MRPSPESRVRCGYGFVQLASVDVIMGEELRFFAHSLSLLFLSLCLSSDLDANRFSC